MKEFTTYQQAKELIPIGTKEHHKCFDEKIHEVTVLDYLVKLYGDTYHNRSLMHELGFRWNGHGKKYWYKSVESDEELENIFKAIEGKTIRLYAKPIFRITDGETNPIEY
jgi:hypothetical protein